jgi:hypothetical protein
MSSPAAAALARRLSDWCPGAAGRATPQADSEAMSAAAGSARLLPVLAGRARGSRWTNLNTASQPGPPAGPRRGRTPAGGLGLGPPGAARGALPPRHGLAQPPISWRRNDSDTSTVRACGASVCGRGGAPARPGAQVEPRQAGAGPDSDSAAQAPGASWCVPGW